jgi:hypothetical protein
MMPTKANWEAPENISKLRTMVCHTLNPRATDKAPKEMPYKETARAT